MAIRPLVRVVLFTFLLCPAAASAQRIASAPTSATPTIQLDVVVTPKSGSPVTGDLPQQDFTLLDNRVPQPITSFRAVAGNQAPIEVVIVIDAVNTSYQQIAFERGEIDKFLRANGGHLPHPTTLAIFTDKGTQIQQAFTTDGNAISDSLDHSTVALRDILRSAGFWGANERLQLSFDAIHTLVSSEAPHPGRKLILWVSPGWPLLTGPAIQLGDKAVRQLFANIVDLSTSMRTSRVTLYGIDPLGVDEGIARTFYYQEYVKGVSRPDQVQIADLSLQVLATQSGGLALSSTGVADLLQKCIADTEAYSELAFKALPAERPNEYHQIEIKLTKPGLLARTRTGYYAQP